MEGGWSGDDDDDGDDLPSPKAKTTSRLALPEKNGGWRRLRDENWKKQPLFWGFLATGINRSRCRAPEGGGPSQTASWRGHGLGRASRAPGPP